MNILLWVLQILLALHTLTGAFWKFSNPPQAVPSLAAMPNEIWLILSVIELLCSVALVLPALSKNMTFFASVAAAFIAGEMLLFCVLHLFSGETDNSPMIYWLVVAAVSGFIALGRFVNNRE